MTKESLESFGITSKSQVAACFSPAHVAAAIGRAGQPIEVATAVLFLASVESSYFTAQVGLAAAPQSPQSADLLIDVPLQWRRGVLIAWAGGFRETRGGIHVQRVKSCMQMKRCYPQCVVSKEDEMVSHACEPRCPSPIEFLLQRRDLLLAPRHEVRVSYDGLVTVLQLRGSELGTCDNTALTHPDELVRCPEPRGQCHLQERTDRTRSRKRKARSRRA